MTAMLEVKDLEVAYGKIEAVKGISFDVDEGEVVTLIGTNGAGKTTTLRTISGLLRRPRGLDHLRGQGPHDGPGPRHRPARPRALPRGPADLPPAHGRGEPPPRRLRPQGQGASANDLQAAYDLFPILRERRAQPAGTFSGGEQQMLAMGRAMMSRPKLLMLDEPSMGLSPLMMKKIMTTVTTLQQQGTTILLVEQNAQAALKRADQGLRPRGRQDRPLRHRAGAAASDDVRKAYLGED